MLDRGVVPRDYPDNIQLATSMTLLFGTNDCHATLTDFNRRCQEQDDSILKQYGILGGDVLEQELPQLDILESIDDGVDIGIDNNNDDDGSTDVDDDVESEEETSAAKKLDEADIVTWRFQIETPLVI